MAKLNEKQLQAIEYLSLPARGGLKYDEIAEKVGVSDRSLYTWRQSDDFNKALVRRTIQRSAEHLPDVLDAVPRHIIEEGNAAMLRTYMQSIGALTDKVEIETKQGGQDTDSMRKEIEKFRKGISGDNGSGE